MSNVELCSLSYAIISHFIESFATYRERPLSILVMFVMFLIGKGEFQSIMSLSNCQTNSFNDPNQIES